MAHLLVGESLPQAQGHLEAVPDFCVDSIWKQQSEWPERLSCGQQWWGMMRYLKNICTNYYISKIWIKGDSFTKPALGVTINWGCYKLPKDSSTKRKHKIWLVKNLWLYAHSGVDGKWLNPTNNKIYIISTSILLYATTIKMLPGRYLLAYIILPTLCFRNGRSFKGHHRKAMNQTKDNNHYVNYCVSMIPKCAGHIKIIQNQHPNRSSFDFDPLKTVPSEIPTKLHLPWAHGTLAWYPLLHWSYEPSDVMRCQGAT